MQAVILAGGYGTRLGKLGQTTPKLLLPIGNKPLIDHLINSLKKAHCNSVIVCTGHLANKIKKYTDQKNWGLEVRLSKEDKPLGTAGALHRVLDLLEDEFFVLYGDIYTTIDLGGMLRFHKRKKANATLAIHKSDHPQDSTVVKIDKNQRIVSFKEKPGDNWKQYGNLTNIALYILKKDVVNFIPKDKKSDFAKDVFPIMLIKKQKMFGYITKEFAKDIGTWERYLKIRQMEQG